MARTKIIGVLIGIVLLAILYISPFGDLIRYAFSNIDVSLINKGVEYGNDAKIYKLNSSFNDNIGGSSDDCVRTYIFDKHIRDKELLKKRIIEFLNTSSDEQYTIKNHDYVQYWFYRKSAALPLNAYYTNDKRTKLSSKSNDEIAEVDFHNGKLVSIEIYDK